MASKAFEAGELLGEAMPTLHMALEFVRLASHDASMDHAGASCWRAYEGLYRALDAAVCDVEAARMLIESETRKD